MNTDQLAFSVQKLDFYYNTSKKALSNINLEIEPQKVTALIGPSGCGKSTLLRVLAGVQRPTTGTIEFDARPVRLFPDGETSFVFQEPALVPWRTMLENIGLPLELRHAPRQVVTDAARAAPCRHPHELPGRPRRSPPPTRRSPPSSTSRKAPA